MKIGVFSDAHGHLAGFDAALDILVSHKCTELFFLGDSVGYLPFVEVLHRLRERTDISTLKGNHDEMLLRGENDSEKDKIYRLSEIRGRLNDADFEFLSSLPEQREVEIDGTRCLFLHGSPSEPVFGYVYPDTDLAPFTSGSWDVVFMGNTHRPFVRKFGGKTFVNVGSCGLPRDNSDKGCACLFDTESGEVRFFHFSLGESAGRILENVDLHLTVADYLDRYVKRDKMNND